MKQKKALINDSRKKIYSLIQKNPGLHLREISRSLEMSKNNCDYHLRYLIKKNLIISKEQGKYLRFYIANQVCNKEKKILLFLRKKPTRDIISIFLTNIVTSSTEISGILEKTPATIFYHLKVLLKNEIIELAEIKEGVFSSKKDSSFVMDRKVKGREILFRLKDIDKVYDTFVKYHETLVDHSSQDLMIHSFLPDTNKLGNIDEHSYHKNIESFGQMYDRQAVIPSI